MTVKAVLWPRLPARRISEDPGNLYCCQKLEENQVLGAGRGRVQRVADPFWSLRDSWVPPPPPAALRSWGRDKGGAARGPGAAGQAGAQLPEKPEVAVPDRRDPRRGGAVSPGSYRSSARMPTERDASAVTASTSSASAPGTLCTQESGREARRCMQPQYSPGQEADSETVGGTRPPTCQPHVLGCY